jgi:catechol 2,3-dioxygenase-like lactoylglutathione lyase family enzyme
VTEPTPRIAGPTLTVSTVNMGARDPHRLARFWCDLLGYHVVVDEPDFVLTRADNGVGVALSAQLEPELIAPSWPASGTDQQMQLHLEVRVDGDLDAAVQRALTCGATLADFQPQDDVRVCLDPEGHPFCLWVLTED